MSPLRPGDVVCCPGCAAVSAPAVVTSSRRWAEGGALIATWVNGPFPRHEVARDDLCLHCDDRRLGFPALMNRPLATEAPWRAGGPASTWEIPPVGAPAVAQDVGVGPSPARADAPPRAHAATGEVPLERPARAQLALF